MEPGHLLSSWKGDKILHKATPPYTTARSRTRHTTAFTCNKSVPTGHTAPESFSTVTRSCHVSGGCQWRRWWCGCAQEQGSTPAAPAGPLPHRGHLTLRRTPGSPALYLQIKHITLHKRLRASSRNQERGNPDPAWLHCTCANGRCHLSSLMFQSSFWWAGGLCSLRLLAPQIVKSALRGGGPKGSKLFIIIFLKHQSALGSIILQKHRDWVQGPQPHQTHWQNGIWSRTRCAGLLYP